MIENRLRTMLLRHCLYSALVCGVGLAASPWGWAQTIANNDKAAQTLLARDAKAIRGANRAASCFADGPTLVAWMGARLKHAFQSDARDAPASPFTSRWWSVDNVGRVSTLETTDLLYLQDQMGAKRTACVLDRLTNLVWAVQLEGDTPVLRHVAASAQQGATVGQLIDQAQSSNWCGRSDWRLPSRTQVLSLADYTQEEGPEFETEMQTLGFSKYGSVLTSTPMAGGPVAAYGVGFDPIKNEAVSTGITYASHRWVVRIPGGSTFDTDDSAMGRGNSALLVSPASCTAFNREFWK